jgi:hypothetical protein
LQKFFQGFQEFFPTCDRNIADHSISENTGRLVHTAHRDTTVDSISIWRAYLFDTLNGMAVARPCRGSRNSILISIKNSAMSQHIADRPNSS